MECFSDMCLWHSFSANQKATSANWKAYSENRKVSIEDDVEGFFQRALSLYVPKHPENRQLAYESSGSFIRPSIVAFRYSAAVFIM